MQTLIPLAYRDLLPKEIWDALTEISHFFRDICSSKLNVDHIERLETNIVETLCKLEMIFPPSFFDSIEHLPIHLPDKQMSMNMMMMISILKIPMELMTIQLMTKKKKILTNYQNQGKCKAFFIM
jgi:hypothetical protein